MKDLSPADGISVLAPTSQEGGNMTSKRTTVMSAPGSLPVAPKVPPGQDEGDPHIEVSNSTQIRPGDNGKPAPREGRPAGSTAWVRTSTAQGG